MYNSILQVLYTRLKIGLLIIYKCKKKIKLTWKNQQQINPLSMSFSTGYNSLMRGSTQNRSAVLGQPDRPSTRYILKGSCRSRDNHSTWHSSGYSPRSCATPSGSLKTVSSYTPGVMEASSTWRASERKEKCRECSSGSVALFWRCWPRRPHWTSAAVLSSTEFGFTTSPKKTQIMGQDVSSAPNISTGDHILKVVDKFT